MLEILFNLRFTENILILQSDAEWKICYSNTQYRSYITYQLIKSVSSVLSTCYQHDYFPSALNPQPDRAVHSFLFCLMNSVTNIL